MIQPNHEYKLKTKPNLGKRALAGMVDYGFIMAFTALITYFFGETIGPGQWRITGLPAVLPVLTWFVLTIGLEQFQGATVGNTLMDLKPASKSDPRNPITFKQSVIRHILDPVDLFFAGAVAIFTIQTSEFNQRVGDLLANTVVLDEKDEEQGLQYLSDLDTLIRK